MKRFLLTLSILGVSLASQAYADITIGVAGPMTGPNAAYGEQMKRGVEAAVEDINKAGGILGQKLVVKMEDDACDPKQAVSVANKLVSQKVPVVVGHFCSDSSIPASDIYAEENIVMISPASTKPVLTDRGLKTVFRTVGRDDQQGQVAADFIKKFFSDKKVAIVHDKKAYSEGLAKATQAALNKNGVKEIFFETINPGESDYSALVSKLKENKIDLIYYGGYHTEAGLIVRQMREQGLNTKLMSGDGMVSAEFWGITGDKGTGTLVTFSEDQMKNPATKEAADLIKRFEAQGYKPEGYTLYSYATLMLLAEAIKKAGGTDTEALLKALRSNEFDTITGKMKFDAKGDLVNAPYFVYEWKKGDYEKIDPAKFQP